MCGKAQEREGREGQRDKREERGRQELRESSGPGGLFFT